MKMEPLMNLSEGKGWNLIINKRLNTTIVNRQSEIHSSI